MDIVYIQYIGLIPGMASKTNSGTSGQKILWSTQDDLEKSKKLVKMFQLNSK